MCSQKLFISFFWTFCPSIWYHIEFFRTNFCNLRLSSLVPLNIVLVECKKLCFRLQNTRDLLFLGKKAPGRAAPHRISEWGCINKLVLPESTYPDIQISRYPNIQISKYLDIQISRYPRINWITARIKNGPLRGHGFDMGMIFANHPHASRLAWVISSRKIWFSELVRSQVPCHPNFMINFGKWTHASPRSIWNKFEINLSIPILDWFWCIPARSSVWCSLAGFVFPEKTGPWCVAT